MADAADIGRFADNVVHFGRVLRRAGLKIGPGANKTAIESVDANGVGSRDAFGWLHTNCGTCHNENQGAGAFLTKPKLLAKPSHLLGLDGGIDGGGPATVQTLPAYATTVCQSSYRDEPDAGGQYLYIRGGDPTRSLLHVLASSRAPEGQAPTSTVQMPPLVTRAVDPSVATKLDTWIANLTSCP